MLTALVASSQTIAPAQSNEYCPGTNLTFTFSVGGNNQDIFVSPVSYVSIIQGAYNVSYNSNTNITTCNFVIRVADMPNDQVLRIQYRNNNNDPYQTANFTFDHVKSIGIDRYVTTYSPLSITANRCETQIFNVTFNKIKFKNYTSNTEFGQIPDYQVSVPTNWKVNGSTSTGTGDWKIVNASPVTVESDPSNGDIQNVQIRPYNSCAANLTVGPAIAIPISRPAPTLTISGSQDCICSGCTNFTINGMPSGATVQWTLSNTTDASISGCSTCSTVTVCRNTSANTTITLMATVTHCTFSYTPTHDISLGTPSPTPINVDLIDPSIGRIQVDVDPALPGILSYNWYKNGILQTAHGSFAQIPITRNVCDISYSISVKAINCCGTSSLVYKDVYVPPCGNFYRVSPNPASNNVIVSPDNSKTQSATNKTFNEVRIYDFQGTLKKLQKFRKANTATINLSGLINGTYVIEIINDNYKEQHQLLIQK